MDYDYDLFVIGAGSGGVRAARMAAGFGAKVAVAEDRYLGGTCVNVGCVPKKLMVYGSHYAEELQLAKTFGWQVGETGFSWQTLKQNKDKEIQRLNGVYQSLLQNTGVDIIEGTASFVDANIVEVNTKQYRARHILIATGSWPFVPEFPGNDLVMNSNDFFAMESLPKSVVVVGGGFIALEFSCILNALGVDVSLSYRGDLFLRGFDLSLREFAKQELTKKGIKLCFNSSVIAVTKHDDQLQVNFQDGSELTVDQVIYATGRKPLTQGMALEKAGVELGKKGEIVVNAQYQTNVENIYAIGDVINRIALTPVALAEGMCVANRLYNNNSYTIDYDLVPSAVFTQPNIGTVGLTEEQARDRFPDDIVIFESAFKTMKLSFSDCDERTYMKLIVQKSTDKVLAAHMMGPEAGEIIQGLAVALKAGATKATFDQTIGIHPTAAEEFVTMRTPAA